MKNMSRIDFISNLMFFAGSIFKDDKKLKDIFAEYREKSLDEIKESILNDFILNSERSKTLKQFEENVMFKFDDYLISQDIKRVSRFIGERFLENSDVKYEIKKLLREGINENSLKEFEQIIHKKDINDVYINMFFQGIIETIIFWGIQNSDI